MRDLTIGMVKVPLIKVDQHNMALTGMSRHAFTTAEKKIMTLSLVRIRELSFGRILCFLSPGKLE